MPQEHRAVVDHMIVDRRALLKSSALLAAGSASGCTTLTRAQPLPSLYDNIEERTFAFFWETVNRSNGLVPDRWPTPSFCSIAAVGFALTAYPYGVERGWVSRTAARDLTLTTLRFFWNAPQGPAASGISGYKGFFYHFLDMQQGRRFHRTELSSVDTTLLLLGVRFAGRFFDGNDPTEREIQSLSEALYARADWTFFQSDGRKALSMGWHPETGLIARNWDGYNEGMAVYLLALGAPVHPIAPNSWEQWTLPYSKVWRGEGTSRHLAFAPLFGHQYSHIWVDFRGIQDVAMRDAGLDYFENSRRATYSNRAYCAANPIGWAGYSAEIWGLTACDGPADVTTGKRQYFNYSARGPVHLPDGRDDGTIAPTAALGSLPFAPEIVVPGAQALLRLHGKRIFGSYGFLDAFNPSFRDPAVPSRSGTVDPLHGWVGRDYLGIDQGPILLQAANHRSEFVWKFMRRDRALRRGLRMAGFQGGWLER